MTEEAISEGKGGGASTAAVHPRAATMEASELVAETPPRHTSETTSAAARQSRLSRHSSDLATFDQSDQLRMEQSRNVRFPRKSSILPATLPQWKTGLRALVEAQWFHVFVGLVIVCNVVFFGVEVQLLMGTRVDEPPLHYSLVGHSFTAFFTLELALKLPAYGVPGFFCGRQRVWHIIEAVLVAISWLEIFVEIATSGSEHKLEYVRMIRIARVSRIFRTVRVMKLFRPLRILVYTICETVRSLLWTLLLLALIIYSFGVMFSSMTWQEMAARPSGDTLAIEEFFGSLWLSILTLFMSITGGVDWLLVMKSLLPGGSIWVFLFIFYIAFCHLAILNVVTGVVLHIAMESAQHDQDIVVQSHLDVKEKYIEKLTDIFHQVDEDRSGGITLKEFESHMQEDNLQAYFHALDMTVDEAWNFFKLLDVSGTSVIDADEFVSGCMRLRGNARSIDLHMLLYESRWAMGKLSTIMTYLEDLHGRNTCPPDGKHSL